MKKTNLFKFIANILIMSVLFGTVSVSLSGCGSLERIDVSRFTAPDELLFSEDFSSTSAGTIPEGWNKTYPFTFLRSADKSTCLETSGGNKTHITVRKNEDKSFMGFLGRDGANITTIPGSYEGDWVMTVDVSFKSFSTPFGVAVGIAENNEDAKQATLFTLSGKKKKTNGELEHQPIFSIYNRVNGGGDFVGKDKGRTDIPIADLLPDSVVISDKKNGTGTVSDTEVIKLQIYRYSGVYYFFANGVPVGDIDDAGTGNRIGFYSDTEGREVQISDVTIHSLCYVPEIDDRVFKLESLVETDFKDGDSLKNWKLLSEYAGEGGAGRLDANILNSGCTSLYRTPSFDGKNVIITAEITPKTEGVSVGVLTNISASVNNSKKGFGVVVDTANSKLQSVTLPDKEDLAEFDIKELTGSEIKAGEVLRLKIYLFEGELYLFVNDNFAYKTAIPTVNRKQHCGIVVSGGSAELHNFKVENIIKRGEAEELTLGIATMSLQDGTVVLGLSGKASLNDPLVAYCQQKNNAEYGFVMVEEGKTATVEDKDAIVVKAEKDLTEMGVLGLAAKYDLTDKAVAGKRYSARGYIAVKDGDKTVYFYGQEKTVSPAALASAIYLNLSEQKDKNLLDTLFEGAEGYIGKFERTVTFGLFSDFHYKYGMYSTSVADMEEIFERANKAGASFVLSAGDMCNDFKGSAEITNAFLNNKYNIPAYNVYGNHELETVNTMQEVTPLITNDKDVVWGTKDGKIGNGSIAYYYVDRDGFRIVCVDTNYSYNTANGEWEHNKTGSWGPPEGNVIGNSLGPVQREWLEEVLTDAAYNSIPCIVIGHASMSSSIDGAAGDASEVREIYARVNTIRRGTVLLSINGHYHTNRIFESEGILYFDMNTARNGVWKAAGDEHYGENHTFEQVEYDMQGNPVATKKVSLGSLTMGKNTWFFEEPLSAVVTVSQYGTITIEGMETRWIYGVNPTGHSQFEMPLVSSGKWELVK